MPVCMQQACAGLRVLWRSPRAVSFLVGARLLHQAVLAVALVAFPAGRVRRVASWLLVALAGLTGLGLLAQLGVAAQFAAIAVAALARSHAHPGAWYPAAAAVAGTPGGTVLQAPPAVVAKMGDLLLPTSLKWRAFFSRQERNPAHLKTGDHGVHRRRRRGARPWSPAAAA
jgi:hypothetical protein